MRNVWHHVYGPDLLQYNISIEGIKHPLKDDQKLHSREWKEKKDNNFTIITFLCEN